MTHKGKPEGVFVAITQPDGNVAVMQFLTLIKRNEEDPGYVREPTRENIEAEMTKSGFGGMTWRIVDPATLPTDRTYRNAWKDEGGKIALDPVKAAAIDEKRRLDDAVAEALKSQHEALVESVKAGLRKTA